MRNIQALTHVEIYHILQEAPKRCYFDIAHELDIGVNTVKRVIRNYNNSIQVQSDAANTLPYYPRFEPSGQSSDRKRSAYKMSSRISKRVQCKDRDHKKSGNGGQAKRYEQLTLY
ncbi:hypothetical protein [Methanomethylovorans sp.]|uniref:hypothetical protein n=1 Tax=Methanomethylovorans sp. TaxID=2758717 RepID=UPI002FDC8B68